MNRNFHPTSHSDVIQRPLTFETSEAPFHGWPLFNQSPKFGRGPELSHLSVQLLVVAILLHYRNTPVLPFNQAGKRLSRITRIHHHEGRMELPLSSPPSLSQYIRRSCCIVDVARTNYSGDGPFRFAVNHEMQLPPVNKFIVALSSFLDRPSGLLVSLLGLTSISPRFKGRAVNGYSLSEAWDRHIMVPYQRTRYVFNQVQALVRSQFLEKSAKRGVMRDSIGGCDATDLSDERVIPQLPPQSLSRCQTKHVFCDEASPQDSNWVSLGATSSRANQLVDKSVVVQSVKNSLKLSDYWGRLWGAKDRGRITVGHGKRYLPVRLGGVGVSSTCALAQY